MCSPADAPDITIALLTCNAGPLLRRVLEAIQRQTTARSWEIAAVDSGSTDGTHALLGGFGARVISIPPESFQFGRTRDLAFENARGAVVVSISQDAVPAHEQWLENLVRPLDDPEYAASCGRSIEDPERGYPPFPWERNGYFYFTREMRRFRARYGRGLSNANSAIRRSVWEALRFGDILIGEDFYFQTKLAPGQRIAFPDDAPVLHHHDYTFDSLAKRCRDEGLALRLMGCPYSAMDMLADLASPRKYWVWIRELAAGRLHGAAPLLFPVVRPIQVYRGGRSGQGRAS